MGQFKMRSLQEAANLDLQGGKWSPQNRLDISDGAEAHLVMPAGHHRVRLYSQEKYYLKFDLTTGSTIATNVDLAVTAGIENIVIPYDLGQMSASEAVVMHVRQIGTNSDRFVYAVLT